MIWAQPSLNPLSLWSVNSGSGIGGGALGPLGFSGTLTAGRLDVFSTVVALRRAGDLTWHVECKD